MTRRELLAGATAAGTAAGLASNGNSAQARSIPANGSRRARAATGPVTTSDGTKLFVRDWGEGAPVLFLHSWALDSSMWRSQFAELGAAGLRCIAFDRRGHGRSSIPPSGYDMDTLADDVAAVVAAFGLRDITLVGHSMGGNEVVRYLGRHGTRRVRNVVLVAPTTPFLTRTADNPHGAPAEYLAGLRAEWAADFPKWVEDNKRPFFTESTSLPTMDWLARIMAEADLPAILACNRAATGTDLRPDLARIDRPTLVIHGDRDASAPLDITGRPTAAGIRGATLKVYEGAPHGLFVTHARQLNADILASIGR